MRTLWLLVAAAVLSLAGPAAAAGLAAMRIHPVGRRHATADAVLLVRDADWKPGR